MNFYTLTYDADLPAAQQVNIPTNTDYKVGVKFTKNGQSVSPLPKNVKLGTLSADTHKTNGYVTFTKTAGDNASYVEDTISVDEGLEYGITQLSALEKNTTGASIVYNCIQGTGLSVEVPDEMVGQTLANAADLSVLWKGSTTEMTVEQAWNSYGVSFLDRLATIGGYAFVIGKTTFNGQPAFVTIPNAPAYTQYTQLEGFSAGDAIMLQNETGTAWLGVVDRKDFAFKKGDVVYLVSQGNQSNNQYAYCGIALQAGTPITANFNLATNVFKSQMGDKADLDESATTVDFAGEYLDGNSFDFNIITK